jgi:DNA-binding NtrC family response regulator
MSETPTSAPDVRRKTVLVVDDDPAILTVIKAILEFQEHRVLLATDAENALQLARQQDLPIDLLLIDVVMPRVNGVELADKVLSIRPNLRILFMSGFANSDIVRVKVLNQSLGFLAKPFDSEGLLGKVRHALEAPSWPAVKRKPATLGVQA